MSSGWCRLHSTRLGLPFVSSNGQMGRRVGLPNTPRQQRNQNRSAREIPRVTMRFGMASIVRVRGIPFVS
jgi:hypothetical protein